MGNFAEFAIASKQNVAIAQSVIARSDSDEAIQKNLNFASFINGCAVTGLLRTVGSRNDK